MNVRGQIDGITNCKDCDDYVNDLAELMHSARSLLDRRFTDSGFTLRRPKEEGTVTKNKKVIELPGCGGTLTFYHRDADVWNRRIDC